MVRAVGVLTDLRLADLTSQGVMAANLGLNLEQLAGRDYMHTQKVSGAVNAMLGEGGLPLFDGVLYPSRNNYPAASVALFERAAHRVTAVDDIDLVEHAGCSEFVADYRIGVAPDHDSDRL